MPIIQVHIAEGRSMEAKHQLFREITDAAVRSLDVRPEQVRIILREIVEGHYSVGGEPLMGVFPSPDTKTNPESKSDPKVSTAAQ